MTQWSNWVIPILFGFIILFGLFKGVDVFDAFIEGAREGIGTTLSLFPALLLLMTTVGMFKASGALDILAEALLPFAVAVGMPKEVIPLALLRPLSGSGALVVFQNVLESCGPDSRIGLIASVLMGSTETTFYTIALYYGAVGVTKTRHSLQSSLAADFTGFCVSVFAVRVLMRV